MGATEKAQKAHAKEYEKILKVRTKTIPIPAELTRYRLFKILSKKVTTSTKALEVLRVCLRTCDKILRLELPMALSKLFLLNYI